MQISKLKLLAYAIAGAGMIVGNMLQKREIREAVDEAMAEREGRDLKHNVVRGTVVD